MDLLELQKKVDILEGKHAQITVDLIKAKRTARINIKALKYNEKAKEIVLAIGKKMQEQIQFHISDITSLALEAVFPNPYKLEIEFVQRRNKTECDIFFTRDGNRVDPLNASGGGPVDVAAFALRIASWSLRCPNNRSTIILDEPMRFVSEDLRDKASLMVKEVSSKLGIQFIIITHDPQLAAYADRVFQVRSHKGISKVKMYEGMNHQMK